MNKKNSLNSMINNVYLKEEIIKQMQDFFEKEAFIQLNSFLILDLDKIKNKFLSKKFEHKYNPMKFNKFILNVKEISDVDLIKFIEFFKSKKFNEYIEYVSKFELHLSNITIEMYGHKSFTILNDLDLKKTDKLEVIFDLSDLFGFDMGGTLTYTTRNEEIFYLKPTFNALTIIFKPKNVIKYLKYINNKAKDKRIVRIIIEYNIKENL